MINSFFLIWRYSVLPDRYVYMYILSELEVINCSCTAEHYGISGAARFILFSFLRETFIFRKIIHIKYLTHYISIYFQHLSIYILLICEKHCLEIIFLTW